MADQRITPCLWYDTQAREAVEFYTSVFPDSKINNTLTLHDTPSGDTEILWFNVMDYSMMAMSAGPHFKINPSISFMINFDPSQDPEAKTRIDAIWTKLAEGGKVLMAIDKYPFSERYGWVEDKFGLSWQLIFTNPEGDDRPVVIPSLLFVNKAYGKAEEASDFYLSVFKDSKRSGIMKYPAGAEPNKEGTVMFTDMKLLGQWFAAMDGGGEHEFEFNEAVSFEIMCKDQAELDYYWEKLSAVPDSEQCGWVKDKFGVSWQIVPEGMNEMMTKGTREQMDRVTQALLKMKKLDLAELQRAYEGK